MKFLFKLKSFQLFKIAQQPWILSHVLFNEEYRIQYTPDKQDSIIKYLRYKYFKGSGRSLLQQYKDLYSDKLLITSNFCKNYNITGMF
jgi:hypothetical protein